LRRLPRQSLWLCALLLVGCSETSLLGLAPFDNEPPLFDAGNADKDSSADERPTKPSTLSVKVPCGHGGDCDPRDLGGETCESLGLGDGQLLCDPVSCTFSLAFCEGLPREQEQDRPCGTGPGCDADDLGGQSCQSLGLAAGVLACDPVSCQLDTSLCGVTFDGFGGGFDDDAGADEDAGVPGTAGGNAGGGFFGGSAGGGFFGGGNAGGGFFGGGD
jgi:hypothetical protein